MGRPVSLRPLPADLAGCSRAAPTSSSRPARPARPPRAVLGRGPHHPAPPRATGRGRARTARSCPAGPAWSCDIGDGAARSWRCAPTSTRCRSPTRRTSPTARPCPASATPAATTCTPRSSLGVGLVLAELAEQGRLPRTGAADLPAGRGVARAAARSEVIDAGRLDGRRAHLRAALRPAHDRRARSGCASAPITGRRPTRSTCG